jgi:hypothetical protein
MIQTADLVVFAALGVVLLAAGRVLTRKGRATWFAGGRPRDMQSLNEAAEASYKAARDESMALATVAVREGNPLGFFARSIVSVVGAWRKNGTGGFEAAKGDGDAQSLYIRRRDIKSYLRWARTVK